MATEVIARRRAGRARRLGRPDGLPCRRDARRPLDPGTGREKYGVSETLPQGSTAIAFSAVTRMSGLDAAA